MARAHKLLCQTSELVYCDSTASSDNLNTAVFIVSCSTSASAIPLRAVMTSSEDAETLSSAFTALVDVLPDYAFFGRGRTVGPLMILTDDSASERKALKITWPETVLHLCVFHFLQSMWRWLWSARSGMSANDRVTCMLLTERLYSPSEEALDNVKNEIDNTQFGNFKTRIDSYWTRRKEWALCFVQNSLLEETSPTTIQKQVFELQRTSCSKEGKDGIQSYCFNRYRKH